MLTEAVISEELGQVHLNWHLLLSWRYLTTWSSFKDGSIIWQELYQIFIWQITKEQVTIYYDDDLSTLQLCHIFPYFVLLKSCLNCSFSCYDSVVFLTKTLWPPSSSRCSICKQALRFLSLSCHFDFYIYSDAMITLLYSDCMALYFFFRCRISLSGLIQLYSCR